MAALLIGGPQPGDTSTLAITPSATDPAIKAFDSPHLVYVNKQAKKRHELLVFLPGTNGKPGGTSLFCKTAADQGYDVIALAYPTDIPATIVRQDRDPKAFENFRTEIIEGRDLSASIQVSRTDSIENRLRKALLYLEKTDPDGEWGQYLTTNDLAWSKIAVSGHSQGGGHACLIGVRHKVARIIMTGAPKDFDRSKNAPAAWYRTPATPISAFFAFNHVLDRQGCDNNELQLNFHALGLDQLGAPARVDMLKIPFGHSRILETNFYGSPSESALAHSTVISDRITPKDAQGEPTFKPVWTYMLTEPVKMN